jgi:predicted MFS family arabinose efflux permease
VVDGTSLAQVLTARDGVILERPAGDGAFEAAEGPVERYQRTVSVTELGDDRFEVTQTVDFHLAFPWFWWVFAPLVRAYVGKLVPPTALPWWAPPQRLDARASTALATVMGISIVVGYTGYLLSTTITYAADDFGVGTTAQGVGLAFGRVDLLISLPLLALADRRGRRPVLLLASAAACILSALGALAPNLPALMATQVPARGCGTAVAIAVLIVAAEEMPAGSRAWSLGLLAFAGATGVGVCIALLPLADLASWRLLYLIALVGLVIVWALRNRLTESQRFARPHPDVHVAGHGGRLWLLAVSTLLLNLFLAPGSQFQNEFLKDERAYSALKIAVFLGATNIFGAIGIVVGGRLADLRGRRGVGAVAVVGGTLFTVLMYNAVGWPIWMWSTLGAILGAAVIPSLTVYGPELFPTGLRGWAGGLISGLGRVGSIVGLVAVGALADRIDSLGPAMAIMSVAPLVLAILILVAYPETARVELEDLNPEDRVG